MKPTAHSEASQSPARTILWTGVVIIFWFGVLLIIHKFTPPIPCNAFVEGDQCLPHATTARHLAEIGLGSIGGVLAGVWLRQQLRQSNGLRSRFDQMYSLLCAVGCLYIAIFLALAITRLVQAG